MMLKIIAIVAAVIAVAVVVVLIVAATKPDTFRYERKGQLKGPPEKVFGILGDFKNWGQWSPWEKKDPAMKRIMGATTAGKGATYGWEGDKNVGVGNMEITESQPP